jgi:hypothetical protein
MNRHTISGRYDYNGSRPTAGYCWLDFLDIWFVQAQARGDASEMGRLAREMAHWAMQMHPELGNVIPPNVVLGEN